VALSVAMNDIYLQIITVLDDNQTFTFLSNFSDSLFNFTEFSRNVVLCLKVFDKKCIIWLV
jgi:hypothetical protein